MQFGWLNLTGFLIVALMMVPNILYALRKPRMENKCTSKVVLVLEQVGRYGSMALMVFPLLVWKFGFSSAALLIIWTVLCMALLLGYFICWGLYFRKPSQKTALFLAILPSGIFILRGLFLRHWLLAAFGVVFAAGHITITWHNHKQEVDNQ